MVLEEIPETGGDFVLTDRQKGIVDSLLAESESLRHFLCACVTKSPEHDLTVKEIIEAYAAYCPNQGWRPLPVTEIHDSLEGLMLDLFAVSKAHSIKRDGGSVRGFRGVRFK
jgi:hypothetical protein